MNELTPLWSLALATTKVLTVFGVVMLAVAYTTLLERRVSAWIQDRVGPNRVGPFGLLQPIADGIKNFLKEETLPAAASKPFFILGPMLAVMPALVTFAVIPFAAPLPTPFGPVDMIVADVPIGILYILALSSLAVYGLVLGGWASNNKYAFLGALRASAQMVSYEVALGLSLISVLILAGNVTLTEVVWRQQTLGLWFVFPLSLGFILFVVSAFAETNRLPFDMPESETDLVGGYHTEYSSFKFGFFFVGEYANMTVGACVMTLLFLGGWNPPGWTWIELSAMWGLPWLATGIPGAFIAVATFALKTFFFLFVFIWVRWTVPRFRYDQVMRIGWCNLLPLAIFNLVACAIVIAIIDTKG
jgi:NADH-quinone oxidoreductase subunit H